MHIQFGTEKGFPCPVPFRQLPPSRKKESLTEMYVPGGTGDAYSFFFVLHDFREIKW